MTTILLLVFAIFISFTGGSPAEAAEKANAQSIQKSQCFPSSAESKNWPVAAIYMHGLFPPPGGSAAYIKYETDARDYLEKLATRHKIRIAVPVSDNVINTKDYGTVHSWTGKSLKSIEAEAEKACGAKLDKPRALIGFSNGGYKATEIANAGCGMNPDYAVIVSIGAPKTKAGNCGSTKYVKTAEHKFPPDDAENYFDDNLAKVSRASGSDERVTAWGERVRGNR